MTLKTMNVILFLYSISEKLQPDKCYVPFRAYGSSVLELKNICKTVWKLDY